MENVFVVVVVVVVVTVSLVLVVSFVYRVWRSASFTASWMTRYIVFRKLLNTLE